jgi:hypothetical protein
MIIKLKKQPQVFFCESFSNADFIIFRLQIMLAGLSPVGRSVAKMQRHKT